MRADVRNHDGARFLFRRRLHARREPLGADLGFEAWMRVDVAYPIRFSAVRGLDVIAPPGGILAEKIEKHGVLAATSPPAGDDQDPVHADPLLPPGQA